MAQNSEKCTAKQPDINAQLHTMVLDHQPEYDRTGTLRLRMICPNCGLKVVYTTHAVIEDA